MRPKPLVAVMALFVVLSVVAGGTASAETFTLDKNHTEAQFQVKHLAISKVTGIIPLASGIATIGDNDIPTAAQATFDLSKLSTQNDKRDDSLRSTDFFDVAKWPTMTFVAKHIEGSAKAFTMIGDLSFHGITKSVTLDGKVEGTLAEQTRRHVTYSLRTQIDRRDWGLTWGDSIPGGALIAAYEVVIELDVDAVTPLKN